MFENEMVSIGKKSRVAKRPLNPRGKPVGVQSYRKCESVEWQTRTKILKLMFPCLYTSWLLPRLKKRNR